jgi:hypothetical protein
VARSRQIILIGPEGGGGPRPLGTLREVREALANYNTASDGTAPGVLERLHGPGMVIEIPTSTPEVTQAIANLYDPDIAFPVLFKMTRALGWRMMDLETGRTFGG